MTIPLITFLQTYHEITAHDQQLIAAAFKPRMLKEGDTLFGGDGICKEMYFICNGVLRIMALMPDGKQVTHYFLKENQFCTILNSFLNQTPAQEAIQAACPAQVEHQP